MAVVSHGSELPFHLVLSQEPVVHLYVLVLDNRAYNVNNSKLLTLPDVKELSIIVLWKDKSGVTFHHEVNIGDLITLEIDILEI